MSRTKLIERLRGVKVMEGWEVELIIEAYEDATDKDLEAFVSHLESIERGERK